VAGTATGDESTAQAPAALRGAAAGAGVFAALCATLLGLGLGRFAFTPLLPALIAARWFGPGQAASLGAANLIGYLGGAAAAAWLAARCGLRTTLRGAMLAIVASLFACAAPIPFHWFFAWRLLSGFAGAVLMVLGPTAGLARVPPARRGLASGIVFLGIGFGIAGSGLGVPVLLGSATPSLET
jgi:MFS family permease